MPAGRRSSRCASPTRPWQSTRKRRCSSRTRSGLPRSGLDVSAPTRDGPAHACAPWQVLLVKCMMDLMDRDRSASPSHRPFPAVKTLGTSVPSLFVVAVQNVARYCTQPARDRESGRNEQTARLGLPRVQICTATGARPCHFCTATGARPCYVCTGTGTRPCRICTATGAHPAHAGTGRDGMIRWRDFLSCLTNYPMLIGCFQV